MTYIRSLVILLLTTAAFHSNAQYSYTFSMGGSHERLNGAYGNHARLFLNFSDNFRLNTEFVRYFEVTEKNENETIGYDYREINLMLNYGILIGEKQNFSIYAALGFNHLYGRKGTEVNGVRTEKYNESGGMTFGIGAFYKLGHFLPYIESRNVSSGPNNYLIFSVGLGYSFGKKKD